MNLELFRVRFYDTRTIGQLYIDKEYFCFTLEDKVREELGKPTKEWKVKNETAIPQGKYKLLLENSPRFGPDTMSIKDVPGYDKIRIHAGNNESDTEGCIILGYRLNDDGTIHFGTTRPAVKHLKEKVKDAIRKGEFVWITIINAYTK